MALQFRYVDMKGEDALHEAILLSIRGGRRTPLLGFAAALLNARAQVQRPVGRRQAPQMTDEHLDRFLDHHESRLLHHVLLSPSGLQHEPRREVTSSRLSIFARRPFVSRARRLALAQERI